MSLNDFINGVESVARLVGLIGLGTVIASVFTPWFSSRLARTQDLFNARRVIYGQLIGALRRSVSQGLNQEAYSTLTDLLSQALLLSTKSVLRDSLLKAGNSAHAILRYAYEVETDAEGNEERARVLRDLEWKKVSGTSSKDFLREMEELMRKELSVR